VLSPCDLAARVTWWLGRLVETGVDDLEPAVAQRPGDDLGPPVVSVEARLGHDHPVGTFHQVLKDTEGLPETPDRGRAA
jgi:hypothetical protein